MRSLDAIQRHPGVTIQRTGFDGAAGFLKRPWHPTRQLVPLQFVASWGMGWDHVSVSLPNIIPRWRDMALAREVFFLPEETVIQIHPPSDEYVNVHPNCLHLWRPQFAEIPRPPRCLLA